nr:hypothetical protein [Tanacetum cinerariifolium]
DSLNAAAGGNLLERSTQDVLMIIKNKSKVRNSRSKSIASKVKACDTNSSFEMAKLTHTVNEQTSDVTTAMTAMLRQFQATQPPAPVKVVEETCVTCGGAHPYYQCLAAGGKTFPEFRDNIQEYVSAAATNYNQGADEQPIVQTSQHPEWFSQPRKPPSPDRAWNAALPAAQGDAQSWISELAKQADARSSFNELLDTPIDFSNFIMHRLNVDTLTPDLLAGPTYELMKGSCSSLTELEYHLDEVYKATTDQLVWVNPEGQQYPHNLLQPLPLIPDHRGRRVIPFEHFINNDLEYLRGDYNKHALWGVSHWWRKRKQFYGYAVNRESARDVYSKQRIIAVTELQIIEWHDYKHLDWISVRRDDDQIYKFKEGDFKRLRLQDIEDMLLLLVQGKLSNLTVEERLAFNVSLRMFTRSIVINRRVEDLQLGVESY